MKLHDYLLASAVGGLVAYEVQLVSDLNMLRFISTCAICWSVGTWYALLKS